MHQWHIIGLQHAHENPVMFLCIGKLNKIQSTAIVMLYHITIKEGFRAGMTGVWQNVASRAKETLTVFVPNVKEVTQTKVVFLE